MFSPCHLTPPAEVKQPVLGSGGAGRGVREVWKADESCFPNFILRLFSISVLRRGETVTLRRDARSFCEFYLLYKLTLLPFGQKREMLMQ